MQCRVHVSGRRNPMVFAAPSTAESYRHAMCCAGRFAWVEYVR